MDASDLPDIVPFTPDLNVSGPGRSAIGMDLTAAGAGFQAGADIGAGSATAHLQMLHAQLAGYQAQSEVEAGKEEADVYRQHLDRTIGAQTAAVGASGVAAYGSPNAAIESTAKIGAQDLERMRLNSMRKAWGFQVQQAGAEQEAKYAEAGGFAKGAEALLTGGAKAYGQFSQES